MCIAVSPDRTKAGVTRVPAATPPFTVGTLRKAIPTHCFERSNRRSFAYLFKDLAVAAVLGFLATQIDAHLPKPITYVAWPLYWFLQGAVCTGLWVIAHECGHQSFSPSQAINDGVGLLVHSCLLVPYYSWKHSHRRHHSNCASLEKDEVFVPPSRGAGEEHFDVRNLAPVRMVMLVASLTMGWPTYLFTNATGRPYDRLWVNHFDPYSPIFSKRERAEVVISDLALVLVIGGLVKVAKSFGLLWLTKIYIVPYFIVNFWLVMITLLQHTHPSLAHYNGKEWDWLRGALSTVDRSYGPLDRVFHHIADTHVTHHLFSQMPHYHAEEATRALKPILGDYYKYDDRNVFSAMWADFRACAYVAPDEKGSGVYWFRK